jgi:hypothetical protein
MEKLLAFLALFQKGEVIANPEVWKKRQVTVTMLAGFLVAFVNLLVVFGVIPMPVNIDTINNIAGGLIAIYNIVMTYITTDKIGIGDVNDGSVAPDSDEVNDVSK